MLPLKVDPPAPASSSTEILRPAARRAERRRSPWRVLAAALALVGLVFLLEVAHRALDVMRGTPLHAVRALDRTLYPATHEPRFRQTVERLAELALVEGNRFELLTTGQETFPRLWNDLRTARRSITVQMYYCEPGAVADSLAAILAQRARAGVRVLFLWDGFGCGDLPGSYREHLRRAGVREVAFRPIRWYSLHRAQHRSHVRAVVVDGGIGYTGGFGIDAKWFNHARPEREWRETNVRFSGPAVAQLQAAFAAGWAEATGELLVGEEFFPEPRLEAGAGRQGAVLYSTPVIGSSTAERFLALSILGARRSLFITTAYFVPDRDFRHLLAQAARAGVDVRVLTAGRNSDVRTTWYAGRAHYEELLASGVRIYAFGPAMMHAKSLVVDGVWASVGSANFDNRSLRLNEEANLVAYDTTLGAALDSLFRRDLRSAREIELDEFRRRGWWQRVLETGAGLLWFLL